MGKVQSTARPKSLGLCMGKLGSRCGMMLSRRRRSSPGTFPQVAALSLVILRPPLLEGGAIGVVPAEMGVPAIPLRAKSRTWTLALCPDSDVLAQVQSSIAGLEPM